jgi:hypothetical protein
MMEQLFKGGQGYLPKCALKIQSGQAWMLAGRGSVRGEALYP